MRDEAKIKEDLEKMRAAYARAFKKLDEVEARQNEIEEIIYKAEKKVNPDN
jgi:hypothetical protein